jgi:hypothetical protein
MFLKVVNYEIVNIIMPNIVSNGIGNDYPIVSD